MNEENETELNKMMLHLMKEGVSRRSRQDRRHPRLSEDGGGILASLKMAEAFKKIAWEIGRLADAHHYLSTRMR